VTSIVGVQHDVTVPGQVVVLPTPSARYQTVIIAGRKRPDHNPASPPRVVSRCCGELGVSPAWPRASVLTCGLLWREPG
jgi:hypothetical protein